MGLYDMVGNMQVKATPDPALTQYDLGNIIPLSDGVYICPDGIFAVGQGRVVYINEDEWDWKEGEKPVLTKRATVFDKWGNPLDCSELVGRNNPVYQAVQGLRDKV